MRTRGGPARVSCVETPILRTRDGAARGSCAETPILRTGGAPARVWCAGTTILRTGDDGRTRGEWEGKAVAAHGLVNGYLAQRGGMECEARKLCGPFASGRPRPLRQGFGARRRPFCAREAIRRGFRAQGQPFCAREAVRRGFRARRRPFCAREAVGGREANGRAKPWPPMAS